MNHQKLDTGVGSVIVTWSDRGLLASIRLLDLPAADPSTNEPSLFPATEVPSGLAPVVDCLSRHLREGEPIGDPPWELIDRSDWTPFQEKVYWATTRIPHGETRTYAWVAARVGARGASRAVGQALRRNPVPVVVPCHRVVPTLGGLGGFMGKQGPRDPETILKRRLLDLEANYVNPQFPFLREWSARLAG